MQRALHLFPRHGVFMCCNTFDLLINNSQVYGTVRNAARGDAMLKELATMVNFKNVEERVKPLVLDVTDQKSITEASERLTAELGEVGLAGYVHA